MNWELIFKLTIGLLSLATAAVVAIAKAKEARIQKKDPTFKLNPKRCEEARDRITVLEGQNKVWLARFDSVDKDLGEIKSGVKTLTNLHLKN